ncbi:hypothetical protein GIB67_040730 [Kingdonia uniflora]|uniref:DEAD-box ATP-dependent RNA helicase 50 n=1 Tax=Kingdonia uniflora TaxID=39325 RepID=A0A7J7KUD5_9MAGN|nr:hypothetical protein GIB67_040730 [Kingdonia uniflora]
MLTKAPINVSETLKLLSLSFAQTSPFFQTFNNTPTTTSIRHHNYNYNFFSDNVCCKSKMAKEARVLVKVSAYTRKNMDTPGAYQLIDEESGAKVIVWGGDEDGDSGEGSIPSEEVLSWRPRGNGKARAKGKEKRVSVQRSDSNGGDARPSEAIANSGKTTSVKKDLAGSFGRLKVQRVRVPTRKVSRANDDDNLDDNRNIGMADTLFGLNSMDTEDGFVAPKNKVAAIRHKRNVPKVSQSQWPDDQNEATRPLRTNRFTNQNPKKLSKNRINSSEDDFEMEEPDVPVPRANVSTSSAPRGGWGRGVPVENSLSDSTNLLKERRKVSGENGFFSRKSFKDLGCTDDVIEALRAQFFTRPSHIQAMAFDSVIEGKSCILADQSGSGKTLSYLVPVIQLLRQEELNGLGKSTPKSPRVVILVPTAELATQVLSNCRSMSKLGVPFRSMVATGGFRQKTQLESLQQDLDVLIATPGRFLFLLKEGFLQLTNLKCAVLDEIDILFGDEDFDQVLESLVNSAPVTTQYLFVTATLPVDIYNKLVEAFPDCEVIMGPGMHRTSYGLEEVLVDCSGDDRVEKTPESAFLNKKSALLKLSEESPVSKTIIFCNKIETCRKVENVLNRFDRKGVRIRVLAFHSAMAQESRLANLKEFLNSQSKEDSLFLICTDRASRGIDFAGVDHVILFDFPRDPSEYVRRVGRTARGAGGKGKAFAFVVGKQVSLALRIMERNQKGHPLHDVPSSYEFVR